MMQMQQAISSGLGVGATNYTKSQANKQIADAWMDYVHPPLISAGNLLIKVELAIGYMILFILPPTKYVIKWEEVKMTDMDLYGMPQVIRVGKNPQDKELTIKIGG